MISVSELFESFKAKTEPTSAAPSPVSSFAPNSFAHSSFSPSSFAAPTSTAAPSLTSSFASSERLKATASSQESANLERLKSANNEEERHSVGGSNLRDLKAGLKRVTSHPQAASPSQSAMATGATAEEPINFMANLKKVAAPAPRQEKTNEGKDQN